MQLIVLSSATRGEICKVSDRKMSSAWVAEISAELWEDCVAKQSSFSASNHPSFLLPFVHRSSSLSSCFTTSFPHLIDSSATERIT